MQKGLCLSLVAGTALRAAAASATAASPRPASTAVAETNATTWRDVAEAANEAVAEVGNYTRARQLKPFVRRAVWLSSVVLWLRAFGRPSFVDNVSNETVVLYVYTRWLRTPWTPARFRLEAGAKNVAVRSIGWGPMRVLKGNAGRAHVLQRGHAYAFGGASFRERPPPAVARRNVGLLLRDDCAVIHA
mmetsp:Transcript_36698/g.113559  ORF Transcript_36698/g.113559 Transcript_36698/m.113559 type:complete len:189 (-) Transcript_36698:59-625(-)